MDYRICRLCTLRRASVDVGGVPSTEETVEKSLPHWENPVSSGWTHGAGYAGWYDQQLEITI